MTILYAQPMFEDFNVDEVIEQLESSSQFLKILGDTFDLELERLKSHIKELGNEGTPIQNPDILFKRLEMRRQVIGPGTDIEIKSNMGVESSGHVTRTRIYLHVDSHQPEKAALDEIIHVLNTCGVDSVEILESDIEE